VSDERVPDASRRRDARAGHFEEKDMAQWYCAVGGQQYGPIELDILRQWLAEGRVKAADLVFTEGMTNWQAASAVADLRGAGPAAPSAAGPAGYRPLAPPNAPGAVASMVCGIIGVCFGCAGLVLGIVAIFQARKAREAIARNPGSYGGGGMATAGQVLGIIGTILGALAFIYMIFVFVFMGTMAHTVRSFH
jgi:hypothetical protein